jgi:hypothetical protein
MMNVGGKIVIECVPDQEVSGSTPIVPVDSRFFENLHRLVAPIPPEMNAHGAPRER